MFNSKMITAIILIAGNSTRFGKNRNKNFELLNGNPVVSYSICALDENVYVDDIKIVCKYEERGLLEDILNDLKLKKNIEIVIGGKNRQESVYNALHVCNNSDIVIIQDGARPMLKQEYINKCIKNMDQYNGVCVGVKSKDTVKIADENQIVKTSTKRQNTWLAQTPQCFDKKILLQCYEKCNKISDITDDSVLLELQNYQVKLIEGEYSNIKITTFEDMEIIKKYIECSIKKDNN